MEQISKERLKNYLYTQVSYDIGYSPFIDYVFENLTFYSDKNSPVYGFAAGCKIFLNLANIETLSDLVYVFLHELGHIIGGHTTGYTQFSKDPIFRIASEHYAESFALDLFGRRPVKAIIDPNYIDVDVIKLSINNLSKYGKLPNMIDIVEYIKRNKDNSNIKSCLNNMKNMLDSQQIIQQLIQQLIQQISQNNNNNSCNNNNGSSNSNCQSSQGNRQNPNNSMNANSQQCPNGSQGQNGQANQNNNASQVNQNSNGNGQSNCNSQSMNGKNQSTQANGNGSSRPTQFSNSNSQNIGGGAQPNNSQNMNGNPQSNQPGNLSQIVNLINQLAQYGIGFVSIPENLLSEQEKKQLQNLRNNLDVESIANSIEARKINREQSSNVGKEGSEGIFMEIEIRSPSWKVRLRNKFKEYTKKLRNRRKFASSKFLVLQRNSKNKILFILDTSGSMSTEIVEEAVNFARSLGEVEIAFFDVNLLKREKIVNRYKHAILGGDTNINKMLEYGIKENKYFKILFSDLYDYIDTDLVKKFLKDGVILSHIEENVKALKEKVPSTKIIYVKDKYSKGKVA